MFDKKGRIERTVSAGIENIYNLMPGAVAPFVVTDASGTAIPDMATLANVSITADKVTE